MMLYYTGSSIAKNKILNFSMKLYYTGSSMAKNKILQILYS